MNYIFVSIVICIILLSFILLKNINLDITNLPEITKFLWFFIVLIINILIMVFIIYYYHYKKNNTIGSMGLKGFDGEKGDNGYNKKSC